MAIKFLKKADKTSATGEETARSYGVDLDKWDGDIVVGPEAVEEAASKVPQRLSVHKFIKVVTTQRMTEEANRDVAAVTARISRLEGMEGHARTGDVRLDKYFPDEEFELQL